MDTVGCARCRATMRISRRRVRIHSINYGRKMLHLSQPIYKDEVIDGN